jgi:hypothetical protein
MSRNARKHAVIIARRAIRAIPREARDADGSEYRAEHAAARERSSARRKPHIYGGKALTRECAAVISEKDAVVIECVW